MQTLTCPYCKEPLRNFYPVKRCEVCRTFHHSGCWGEYGRCSVFGCVGAASLKRWNYRLMIPSLILTLSLIHRYAALILSPLFLLAFLLLVTEIIYFFCLLVDKVLVAPRLGGNEVRTILVYLFVNLIPLVLRFGIRLPIQ